MDRCSGSTSVTCFRWAFPPPGRASGSRCSDRRERCSSMTTIGSRSCTPSRGGARLPLVENQRRRAVGGARPLKNGAPDVLGAAEHFCGELSVLVRRRAFRPLAHLVRGGDLLGHVQRG